MALRLAAALLLWLALAAGAAAQVRELGQARLEAAGAVREVRLPHVLAPTDFPRGGGLVTYHLALELPARSDETLALYIRKASRAARVRVNGQEVGGCGAGRLDRLNCQHRPLMVTVPPALWRAGANEVAIEVWASGRQPEGLSPVVVGPAERIHDDWFRPRQVLQRELVWALQWSSLALGIVSLIASLALGGERLFLWFGLAAIVRALGNALPLGVQLGTDPFWSHWALLTVRLAAIPLTALMLMAFFQRRMPRMERMLLGYLVVLPAGALVAVQGPAYIVALALPGLMMAVFLGGCAIAVTLRTRSAADVLLLATVVTLLACGFHDVLLQRLPALFLDLPLMPYVNGLILLVLGGLLMRRLTRALRLAGTMNRVLGERIAQRESELADRHATIVSLERQRARAQEREQLLRELHDGLGSNLSSARMQLDGGALSQEDLRRLLDDCIDDMRLILDSTAPGARLADALGSLRYRLDARLAATGAASMSWRIGLDTLPELPAQARLSLLRLLQEALANALRHARAQRITVTARHEPATGRLVLAVEDDGVGFDAAGGGRIGRGLAHMRQRASQLGARLDIASGPQGTRVWLSWTPDLPAPAPAVRAAPVAGVGAGEKPVEGPDRAPESKQPAM